MNDYYDTMMDRVVILTLLAEMMATDAVLCDLVRLSIACTRELGNEEKSVLTRWLDEQCSKDK